MGLLRCSSSSSCLTSGIIASTLIAVMGRANPNLHHAALRADIKFSRHHIRERDRPRQAEVEKERIEEKTGQQSGATSEAGIVHGGFPFPALYIRSSGNQKPGSDQGM